MKKNWHIWLFLAVVVAVPFSVFGVVKWYEKTFDQLPVLGTKGHTVASFSMVNQHNSPITIDNWNNKIVIADFFFTHCPVICPKMTASLKRVQQAYAGDEDILINSFTVDPERDFVAQLQKYAERFDIDGSNWHLLTGPKIDIYRLARKSFLVVATDGDGGANDFIHSERLVLVDKQKRIRGYYDGTDAVEVDRLISDIKKLKKEK